jgi:hypothetical protein
MYKFVLDSSLSRSIRDLKVSLSIPDDEDWESSVSEDARDA